MFQRFLNGCAPLCGAGMALEGMFSCLPAHAGTAQPGNPALTAFEKGLDSGTQEFDESVASLRNHGASAEEIAEATPLLRSVPHLAERVDVVSNFLGGPSTSTAGFSAG